MATQYALFALQLNVEISRNFLVVTEDTWMEVFILGGFYLGRVGSTLIYGSLRVICNDCVVEVDECRGRRYFGRVISVYSICVD